MTEILAIISLIVMVFILYWGMKVLHELTRIRRSVEQTEKDQVEIYHLNRKQP